MKSDGTSIDTNAIAGSRSVSKYSRSVSSFPLFVEVEELCAVDLTNDPDSGATTVNRLEVVDQDSLSARASVVDKIRLNSVGDKNRCSGDADGKRDRHQQSQTGSECERSHQRATSR
jgi:hypothetical protein